MYVQNPNPVSGKAYTVKEIRASASTLDKADTIVTLKGRLTERINHDTFWFSDETGKIKAELDDDVLYEFVFDPVKTVTIVGEVDHDLLEGTEVEVEYLEVDSE
jgi:uncharacterized protein (TIGR00156 family)